MECFIGKEQQLLELRVYLGVEQSIVGSPLYCSVGIVQCLLRPLVTATVRNTKKLLIERKRLTSSNACYKTLFLAGNIRRAVIRLILLTTPHVRRRLFLTYSSTYLNWNVGSNTSRKSSLCSQRCQKWVTFCLVLVRRPPGLHGQWLCNRDQNYKLWSRDSKHIDHAVKWHCVGSGKCYVI